MTDEGEASAAAAAVLLESNHENINVNGIINDNNNNNNIIDDVVANVKSSLDENNSIRTNLNGCWILDRNRGFPSMRKYLETMGVDELAIQAHEKGESEFDTHHTIELDAQRVKVIKRSRVNNDLCVDLMLGQEKVELLAPGNREKKSMATSTGPTQLTITSSLLTVNGLATVVDHKELIQEEKPQPQQELAADSTTMMTSTNTTPPITVSTLKQELTITNATTNQSHTTVRYFMPYTKTPPHLEDVDMIDDDT